MSQYINEYNYHSLWRSKNRSRVTSYSDKQYTCITQYCVTEECLQRFIACLLLDGGYYEGRHWRKAHIHGNNKYSKISIDKKNKVIRMVRMTKDEYFSWDNEGNMEEANRLEKQ